MISLSARLNRCLQEIRRLSAPPEPAPLPRWLRRLSDAERAAYSEELNNVIELQLDRLAHEPDGRGPRTAAARAAAERFERRWQAAGMPRRPKPALALPGDEDLDRLIDETIAQEIARRRCPDVTPPPVP